MSIKPFLNFMKLFEKKKIRKETYTDIIMFVLLALALTILAIIL
jgi:hypothetical protein